ncbi:hypothetical protein C7999DRAFT_34288 [Corynascus novoguineensis]|uniref:RING-type E3 ubiquitin transferase n=1 Tax=Corynascus novoguineensis TaxID=1126955 RepID=A0AAN7HKZ3_9PEZI|nr:hypothetical protein C7999DRAFT_34288 [Corynascus novoguineensis]
MSDNANVLLFSNPSWKGGSTISSTVIRNITALSGDLSYSAQFAGNTTTLSTRFASVTNGAMSGLLFVPDLPAGDSCNQETAPYVPLSAVRQADLPPTNYHLIAIAPWVNGRCADDYLDAARKTPVRAFLFYQPGGGSNSPPSASAEDWHIDGGSAWMKQTSFPVYAISGMVGEVMMQHLSLYSGNISEVPFGRNLTDRSLADPADYLRIWTELEVRTPRSGFETWVYILIILAVLLTVITATSFLMHCVQAWRRMALRRRVIAGEVNLEAMGIRHLTVPMSHIKGFPLYTYHYEPETMSPPTSPQPVRISRTRSRTRTHSVDAGDGFMASRVVRSDTVSGLGLGSPFTESAAATDYQPNCEICLETYENRATVIRELPCGHIFHPECIDEFLHEISSLCPICKANMLPEGYCPKVTNSMVRRERAIRRLRGQVEIQDDSEEPSPGKLQGRWMATKSKLLGGSRGGAASPISTELRETRPRRKRREPQQIQLQLRPNNPPDTGPQGRGPPTTALARERMRELAGYEPDYGDAGLSRWQRLRTRIFPGFE